MLKPITDRDSLFTAVSSQDPLASDVAVAVVVRDKRAEDLPLAFLHMGDRRTYWWLRHTAPFATCGNAVAF